MINVPAIIDACDIIARHCTEIAEGRHGSAWLFDKLMRCFDAKLPAEAVTFPVYVNLIGPGEATVHIDGRFELRRAGAPKIEP